MLLEFEASGLARLCSDDSAPSTMECIHRLHDKSSMERFRANAGESADIGVVVVLIFLKLEKNVLLLGMMMLHERGGRRKKNRL